MEQVHIKREFKDNKETLGSLTCKNFTCVTLELPDKNNENGVSCIPTGKYTCKYTRSERLSKLKGLDFFTYEILNVPNRSGIRVHSANYFHDLRGCIALGVSKIDIDKDGELDITGSRDTIKEFEKFMNYKDFELTIE